MEGKNTHKKNSKLQIKHTCNEDHADAIELESE